MKMKVGVIGCGRIGRLHTENLVNRVKGVEVKTVADIMANDETREWAKSLEINNVEMDPEVVFQDKEIQAVFICSSTDTHVDFITKAANSGKHVFCEKPVGSNPEKIQTALDAVKKANVKFQVGFVRRFDHNHKAVADAVREGVLGNVEIVKVTSRDPEPPPISYVEKSGGMLFDMMIHDFDMARFLAGCDICEVYAEGAAIVDPKVAEVGDVDTAIVTLKFVNGAIGVIENSRRAGYGYDQRTEVLGSLGCIKAENDRPDSTLLLTADSAKVKKPLWFFLERYNDAFIAEEQSFIDAIQNDNEVAVSGEDALKNVIVAAAATQSLHEHRPVTIK